MKKTTRCNYIRALCGLICIVVSSAVVNAQISGRADGMRFVPDPAGQFRALMERPDPLGLRIGNSPNPSACRHYQALTRVDGADGTPFFIVTRSGNTPNPPGESLCDDSPGEKNNGNLIIFRLGSRDKNGERLRSNRLQKGVHVNNTEPPAEDIATIYYTVVGGDPMSPDPAEKPGLILGDGPGSLPPPRVYQHPGGMQLIGKILAIAVEHPRPFKFADKVCRPACNPPGNVDLCNQCNAYERASDPTLIMFFDVSNPEAPIFKSQFAPRLADGITPFAAAGAVAITPLANGRYLMVVIGNDHSDFHFFRSTLNDFSGPNPKTDLSRTDLNWERVDAHPGPNEDDDHQTLNFLREGNINGRLYLAGARGHAGPEIGDQERIDLYEVTCASPECNPGEEVSLTRIHTNQFIKPEPNSGGDTLLSLSAASGFYVSPTGELLLYATEHDNDGPGDTVKAGEWRHKDIFRPGSPLVLPTARVSGPIEMDEGSTTELIGSAGPPIAKPWIQLFTEPNFRHLSVMADYADYDRDDFDNFFVFERLILENFFNDATESLKWFAPTGCTIKGTDVGNDGPDDVAETLTLAGDGTVRSFADLNQVFSDGTTSPITRELDAVDFLADCDTFYNTSFLLQWDLDVNGSFETTGSPVIFSSLAFDGPSIVNVPAQAVRLSGGQPGLATAVITVRNVAPEMSQFGIADGAGNQMNVDVPFALTGLPLTINAGFSDPGVLDHQTAAINWGDGLVESNPAFTAFNEAFGDGIGSASHTHTYNVAGSYPLAFAVADDDGGTDSESMIVRVVTPEQAVTEMIAMLDAAIASCPNSAACFDLHRVRVALAGSNPESVNGALNMIRAGDRPSARAFLNTAGTWLERASADGATGLGTLQALVTQVAAALVL